jgi:hypothetical protein
LVLANLCNVFKPFLYRIEGLNAFLRYIASQKLHDTGLVDQLHRCSTDHPQVAPKPLC